MHPNKIFKGLMLPFLVAGLFAQLPNRIVSTGYDVPAYAVIASGQVTTLFVRGLQVPDAVATGAPWPGSLSGIVVRVRGGIPNYPDRLPIFRVRSYDWCGGRVTPACPLTEIMVQIPTEPTCVITGTIPNECLGPSRTVILVVEENGVPGQEFPVIVVSSNPHFLNACDTVVAGSGFCYPLITHGDGSLVTGFEGRPAKPGETIVVYALGLGSTRPIVKTGETTPIPAPVIDAPLYPLLIHHRLQVIWAAAEQRVIPEFVGLVPGQVGLYQMNVRLPEALPDRAHRCLGGFDANTRITLGDGSNASFGGRTSIEFCVAP